MPVTANNFFGNGMAAFFGELNCGLLNIEADPVQAQGNYWGAATGPGDDPADRACEVFGVVEVTTFATKPFAVSPPTRR